MALTKLLSADGLGVRVETEQNTLVDQWVLVLRPGALLDFRVGRPNDGLDLSAVNETSHVGVGDFGGWQTERNTSIMISNKVNGKTNM